MPDTVVWEVQGEPKRGLAHAIRQGDHLDEPRDAFGVRADAWFVGQSSAIERHRARATQVGREGSPVALIHGEAGSGKRYTAEWMHRCSSRAARALLTIDAASAGARGQLEVLLASISDDTKGPLAGTVVVTNGEHADEALLERLVQLLGNQGISLVCAIYLVSALEPTKLRERSLLHAQLLARAGGAEVAVPNLRVRAGDVAELARAFTAEAAQRYAKPIRGLSPQAVTKLDHLGFPGNVAQLRAMIEQAVLSCTGDWVTVESFPTLRTVSAVSETSEGSLTVRLPGSSLREIEIAALRLALQQSGGRIVRASEILGITRHALRRKLEKFGLNDLRASR
ncbi:helix-turn-helix domain-containing protein [Plesiocystis pacifica]|uniref:helix-turn-helix domain-containing protein n=1 Tax=Plesiocystis pacifica TaxID=191768 RepID=UPI0018DE0BC2|nr:helix-turn-helix domain-containing protein [Plesiocystis pacifica]